jgi:hypothetical protein
VEDLEVEDCLGGSSVVRGLSLATQEAEIRRIMVQRQPRQTVPQTESLKKTHDIKAGGVTQSA